MKLYNILKNANLKKGQKITVITYGELGLLTSSHINFYDIEPKASYHNCPKEVYGISLLHTRRGKLYKENITSSNRVLIYLDWIDIDLDKILYLDSDSDSIFKSTRYTCFSKQYMYDVLTIYKEPIVKYNI